MKLKRFLLMLLLVHLVLPLSVSSQGWIDIDVFAYFSNGIAGIVDNGDGTGTATIYSRTLQPFPYGGQCIVYDDPSSPTVITADASDVIEYDISWQITVMENVWTSFDILDCEFDWQTYHVYPTGLVSFGAIYWIPDEPEILISEVVDPAGSHCEQPYNHQWGELFVSQTEDGHEVDGSIAWLTLKWQVVEDEVRWTVETTLPNNWGQDLYIRRRDTGDVLYRIRLREDSHLYESGQSCHVEVAQSVLDEWSDSGLTNLLYPYPD